MAAQKICILLAMTVGVAWASGGAALVGPACVGCGVGPGLLTTGKALGAPLGAVSTSWGGLGFGYGLGTGLLTAGPAIAAGGYGLAGPVGYGLAGNAIGPMGYGLARGAIAAGPVGLGMAGPVGLAGPAIAAGPIGLTTGAVGLAGPALAVGGGAAVSAAVLSNHQVGVYDVPTTGFIQPITIDVPANVLPVNFVFRSASSQINVAQNHEGAKGSFKETASQDEPHVLKHTVTKPILQEVREVISPFRRIMQTVEPVREEVQTLVARGVGSGLAATAGTGLATAVATGPTGLAVGGAGLAVAGPAGLAIGGPGGLSIGGLGYAGGALIGGPAIAAAPLGYATGAIGLGGAGLLKGGVALAAPAMYKGGAAIAAGPIGLAGPVGIAGPAMYKTGGMALAGPVGLAGKTMMGKMW